MSTVAILVTIAIVKITNAFLQCTISLEAEEGIYTGFEFPRGNASNYLTVCLKQGQYIAIDYDTPCTCSMVTVMNVIYMNDGHFDIITLSLDGKVVGTFRTISGTGGGQLWNIPQSSGRVGNGVVLQCGAHTVRIEAIRTDRCLVEIDRVVMKAHCGKDLMHRSTSTEESQISKAFNSLLEWKIILAMLISVYINALNAILPSFISSAN